MISFKLFITIYALAAQPFFWPLRYQQCLQLITTPQSPALLSPTQQKIEEDYLGEFSKLRELLSKQEYARILTVLHFIHENPGFIDEIAKNIPAGTKIYKNPTQKQVLTLSPVFDKIGISLDNAELALDQKNFLLTVTHRTLAILRQKHIPSSHKNPREILLREVKDRLDGYIKSTEGSTKTSHTEWEMSFSVSNLEKPGYPNIRGKVMGTFNQIEMLVGKNLSEEGNLILAGEGVQNHVFIYTKGAEEKACDFISFINGELVLTEVKAGSDAKEIRGAISQLKNTYWGLIARYPELSSLRVRFEIAVNPKKLEGIGYAAVKEGPNLILAHSRGQESLIISEPKKIYLRDSSALSLKK